MPFDQNHNASPFNALPPVAVVAALAMVVIELVLEMAQAGYIGGRTGVGWRLEMLERFAFSGPLVSWMLVDTGRWSFGILIRFVSYPFVHGSFTHMMFSAVILLALGKFVGEKFSGLNLALVWLGSAIAGALGFMLLTDTQVPLYGGMPPAYGLVGAFTFLLWQRARQTGQSPLPAFRMIGVLVALQLVFGALAGGVGSQIVAELAGFCAGFVLSFLLAPGGWTDVVAAIRRR